MKRKLLFLATFVVSVLGMSAQSWTAPTLTSETPVSGTQYKVMNVEAGKYLDMGKAWFSWGTTAVLSDNGIDFTMTADGSNWKFIRIDDQGVFTSGNGVPGDAMHVDNVAHTYGITKLANGNYHIHDAGDGEYTTGWGYIKHNGVWGPVAHADITTIGAYGEWAFLTEDSYVIYDVRVKLYNLLNTASEKGVDTDAAAAVYNNASATADELNSACVSLDAAIVSLAINGGTGVDLTSFFENADFEKGNLTGWTSTNGGDAANNGNFSLHKGTWFVERWTGGGGKLSNGSLIHNAVNVPAGIYCISADAQNIQQGSGGAGSTGLFLYANDDKTEIGSPANYSVYTTLDEDGPLTIKFVLDNCTGNWVCYDNIVVKYYAQASDLLTPAIAAAEALDGKIPTAAYAALQQVVATNNLTSGTTDDYLAAAEAINAAVVTYTEMVAPYATWKALISNAKAYAQAGGHAKIAGAIEKVEPYGETLATLDDLNNANKMATAMMTNYQTWDAVKGYANAMAAVSSNNATAKQDLQDAISAQATVISNAAIETKEEIATLIYATLPGATAALRTAMNTYVNAAQPTNDECFDLTGLIVNPHFTEGTAADPTGWTASWPDKPGGGWSGNHELRIATHNFEAYHKAFELSQTITNLPKGTYKVTLQGFARHDGDDKDKTNLFCGIINQPFMNITDEYSTTSLTEGKPAMGDGNGESSYKLNDETVYQPNGMSGSYYYFQETNPATNKPFYTNEVQTLIAEAGDLTIGFKCETWSDWVIWDNFHLYYYGSAIAVTIDEDESITFSEDIENANVTLNRTIKNGDAINTLVLPFDMTADEVTATFGGDAKVYVVDSYDAGTITFKAQDGINANEPCLLTTSTAGTSYTLENRILEAGTPTVTYGDLSFIGSYAASITVPEGSFVLSGGKFYDVDSAVTLKGTRAYFAVTGGDIKALNIVFEDEEATAIANINSKKAAEGASFNMAGQRVGADYKGIVIKNGKKVLVK